MAELAWRELTAFCVGNQALDSLDAITLEAFLAANKTPSRARAGLNWMANNLKAFDMQDVEVGHVQQQAQPRG